MRLETRSRENIKTLECQTKDYSIMKEQNGYIIYLKPETRPNQINFIRWSA